MAEWTPCTEALGFISLQTSFIVTSFRKWLLESSLSSPPCFRLICICFGEDSLVKHFPSGVFFLIVIITVYGISCQHSRFSTVVHVRAFVCVSGCRNAGYGAFLTISCVHRLNWDLSLKSVKKLNISRTCAIKILDLHHPVNRGGFSFARLLLRCMMAMLMA